MVGSYQNVKLTLSVPNERRFTLKTTKMEDDLNILKVEYLSNDWLDLMQILNLRVPNLSLQKPLREDDPNGIRPQKLNVDYLSNHWVNLIKILDKG
jgi:hypothetical protein